MTMKLSGLTCRIFGYGMFEIYLGQAMANDFKEVQLYVPWKGPFPTPDKLMVGYGIPGIKRVDSFEDDEDQVDLFCFFDVGDGDKQAQLRRRIAAGDKTLKPGARVFGHHRCVRKKKAQIKYCKQLRQKHKGAKRGE